MPATKYLIILLLMMLPFLRSFGQSTVLSNKNLPEDVGDINFDPKIDKADFCLCHKDFIIQYYNFGTGYQGGSRAIKDFLLNHYHYRSAYKTVTGYITIRFIINCKGETDRFRVSQINNKYQKTSFNGTLIAHLFAICKALNKWMPGKDDKGNIYDSYYYLNFKMANGHIENITP